ncbi:UNVERIFIED_CONTAM: Peptidyl-prolyl cis-trans isomerase FKBP16-3, chloroplastic [Sesamum calycinum]|uniref:Peptidyl-prolyl cis-trans isomerase FKBP16-3, chloroplastic n=1 Tax=Sesamum calycinum TaxID=2727403 RepID=A0AAW2ISR8_9LAMI
MCSLCERATVECAEDGRVKEANVLLPLCKASSGGDASEKEVIEAMQKIASHIKNPSKFNKASKLAIQLIEAGSIKEATRDHFFAVLEAAMFSLTTCNEPSLRADYHALFSAAEHVAYHLSKKQQNLLHSWTIRAVWANDLFTDDSFVVPMVTSKFGLQYKDIKVGGRRSPPVGFQVAANYVAVVPSSQIFDRQSNVMLNLVSEDLLTTLFVSGHLIQPTSSKSPIACASAFETLEGSDDEDIVTDVDKLDTTYLLSNGNVKLMNFLSCGYTKVIHESGKNECHLWRSERLRTKVKNRKEEGQVEERHGEPSVRTTKTRLLSQHNTTTLHIFVVRDLRTQSKESQERGASGKVLLRNSILRILIMVHQNMPQNSHSAAEIMRFANYGCCILLCCSNDFVSVVSRLCANKKKARNCTFPTYNNDASYLMTDGNVDILFDPLLVNHLLLVQVNLKVQKIEMTRIMWLS